MRQEGRVNAGRELPRPSEAMPAESPAPSHAPEMTAILAETSPVEDAYLAAKLGKAEEEQEKPNEVDSPRTESSGKDDSSNFDSSAVEVFVGGLPPDTREEQVQQAFSLVGQVIGLRLNRRKRTGECKGFGFVRYNDQATAERACAEVQEVCGKPVGVHISRGRSVDQLVEDQLTDMQDDSDPDASVNKLLRLLCSHTDKKAATAAALKAVLTLPSRKVTPAEETALDRSPPPTVEPIEPIPNPESFLDGFPRCKHLVETFRANPSTHNKTPLAILHEYATRLGLELAYNETSEGTLGPFNVEAKLTSVGGSVLYATGAGRGRGKKDAKQVSAAAVLEMLLVNVPESDFLMPGKAKQAKTVQPSPRLPGRADYGRGRGRIRPSGGRYMAQRSPADYIDSQSTHYYNETPYSYAIGNYAPSLVGGGNNHYDSGISQHLALQQQQQGLQQQSQQNFGMAMSNGVSPNLAASVGLGHVGDARGLSLQFQQSPNLPERPFSTAPFSAMPGPVFNPGTGFVGTRSSPAYVNSPQDYINAGHLNIATPPPSSNMPPVNMGPAPPSSAGPYQAVYNMSPNSIPLGAGRPPMGMGF